MEKREAKMVLLIEFHVEKKRLLCSMRKHISKTEQIITETRIYHASFSSVNRRIPLRSPFL